MQECGWGVRGSEAWEKPHRVIWWCMGWEGSGKQLWVPGAEGRRSGSLESDWEQPRTGAGLGRSGFARREEVVLLSWLEAGVAWHTWVWFSWGSFSPFLELVGPAAAPGPHR